MDFPEPGGKNFLPNPFSRPPLTPFPQRAPAPPRGGSPKTPQKENWGKIWVFRDVFQFPAVRPTPRTLLAVGPPPISPWGPWTPKPPGETPAKGVSAPLILGPAFARRPTTRLPPLLGTRPNWETRRGPWPPKREIPLRVIGIPFHFGQKPPNPRLPQPGGSPGPGKIVPEPTLIPPAPEKGSTKLLEPPGAPVPKGFPGVGAGARAVQPGGPSPGSPTAPFPFSPNPRRGQGFPLPSPTPQQPLSFNPNPGVTRGPDKWGRDQGEIYVEDVKDW
ncbi:unnamed protein product [Arctia plantaginis]|uniref:Uncharacterized protein n=1 Tax=Arctia plantaginis TaxID=874455 RepID=A0A8S0YQY8_ARCPL|nr:unnamed protein product [Arctia plantaginis]